MIDPIEMSAAANGIYATTQFLIFKAGWLAKTNGVPISECPYLKWEHRSKECQRGIKCKECLPLDVHLRPCFDRGVETLEMGMASGSPGVAQLANRNAPGGEPGALGPSQQGERDDETNTTPL